MGPPELVLHHTVDLLVVYSPKKHLLLQHTRVRHGYSLELQTQMLFSMMTNGKNTRRKPQIISVSTMLFLVNKRTRTEERCTSKIRLKNTLMRSSRSLRAEHTSTSVVLRE